jgi:hypothetical protein
MSPVRESSLASLGVGLGVRVMARSNGTFDPVAVEVVETQASATPGG